MEKEGERKTWGKLGWNKAHIEWSVPVFNKPRKSGSTVERKGMGSHKNGELILWGRGGSCAGARPSPPHPPSTAFIAESPRQPVPTQLPFNLVWLYADSRVVLSSSPQCNRWFCRIESWPFRQKDKCLIGGAKSRTSAAMFIRQLRGAVQEITHQPSPCINKFPCWCVARHSWHRDTHP